MKENRSRRNKSNSPPGFTKKADSENGEKIYYPPEIHETCKVSVNISSNTDFEGFYKIVITDTEKKVLYTETTNSNCGTYFLLPCNEKYHIVVTAPAGMSPSAQHNWIYLNPEKGCGLNYIFTRNK